ncbi:hypothetical protein NYD60_12045 [Burkholderia thailandensis]|uniref:hypothetical protein n=1 Tax=Burkholderia thailandensis TaxID=57975 RepID=UPI00217F13D2|nr:hypothetical protein [Burkholderia thailandensis]MCS6500747.1 hypothetical protein [Burkholderia thailandensis]
MTNLDCLTNIITFSRHAALAQAFVMDALSKHAAHIAGMPLDELKARFCDYSMISADAWQSVARQIHEALEAHFADQSPLPHFALPPERDDSTT